MLFEVLLATTILVTGLLAFIASIGSAQKLGRTVEENAVALATCEKLMERLRADTSWGTIYSRLRIRSVESTADTGLTWLKTDRTLMTQLPSAYFSGFTVPASLGTVTVLVQVPRNIINGVPGLRENMIAPRYGLPSDLNGDGVIDDKLRDTDYLALPIVIRVRWVRKGRPAQEVVMATWLRGERG